MHVSPVLIYQPGKDSAKAINIDSIKHAFSQCLNKSPILTQKLLRLPMGLDEPYWIDDKHFDIKLHISEYELPKPGSRDQFKQLLARLHSEGLNLEKPLWHAYLITGLDHIGDYPSGSTALMLKVHHAAIDGVSLSRLLALLHDDSTNEIELSSIASPSDPDQIAMWSQANMKHWTRPIKLMNTVSRLIPAVSKLRELKRPANLLSKTRHKKTRFNTQVSRERVIGSLQIPVEDLKSIKRSVRRVTPNDIAVSIVGGALREYLQFHHELPKASLVCGAPINLRSRDDGTMGNNIATMQIGLATDIADPLERVRAVHQYALMGKAKINTLGTGTVMDISASVAPVVLAEGLRALSFASTRVAEIPVPFHVMISNVPGPRESLYLNGAPLHSIIGLGPIRHSMGLFHVVTQSFERYSISFTSCQSILGDADFYEQCLRNSFEELQAAAE